MGGYCGPRFREPAFQQQQQSYNNGYHHGGGPARWLPDYQYRPPPGHGKQAGRHLYHDEFGHGFVPSRSNDKIVDGESCWPAGRHGKNNGENRESFGQRDSKVHPAEFSPQPNGPGRPNNLSEQKSVDIKSSYNSSDPSSNLKNSPDLFQLKHQHDTNDGVDTVGGTCQKLERENTLDVHGKPIKWARSGSLSSRDSSFDHSINSKGMSPDFSEINLELIQKDASSVQSPSGTAAADKPCVTPVSPSEQTNSRKKPRLSWGEGLLKYEKEKVIGVEDSINSCATACTSNSRLGHSYSSSLTDRSPRLVTLSECASPLTPSVACNSSTGLEGKERVNIGLSDKDDANKHKSPTLLLHNLSDQSTLHLENVHVTLISQLSSSISEVLQSDNPSSIGPSFTISSAINKLLVLKNDIPKELETTESEIDMLENELKSLIPVPESKHCLGASISVLDQCSLRPCEDHSAVSNTSSRPTTLQPVLGSSDSPKDDHIVLKELDVNSPGTATSKFVGASSSLEDVFLQLLKGVKVLKGSDANKSNSEMDNLVKEMSSGFSFVGDFASSDDDNFQSGRCDFPCESLLASNRECAHTLSEEFNKLLPSNAYDFDFSSIVSASCVENNNIKESFLRKKNDFQLKEKLLTLKFRMLGHLCKEDIQLLSLKKLRTKSLKKFDLSLQRGTGDHLKLRTSIRSQCSSNGGSLVPSAELINYANRLLAEPQVKPHRDVLKMPSMILDSHDRTGSLFISSNSLVEDPFSVEKERSLFNPWSTEEKEKFIDMLAIVGKDFAKIASSLDHKTTADCIEFYYKNHKSEAFERAKKPEFAKQAKACSASTYLLTSGKIRNCEANAVSLDMLGAASAFAASMDESVSINLEMETIVDRFLERLKNLDVCYSKRETVAANVLAGICSCLSPEAMSSSIKSPGKERKYQRIGSVSRMTLSPDVSQNVDEGTCSDESCAEINSSDWTDEEKSLLIQAVSSYGRDFTMISRRVKTRSLDQCKVFFSKARKCLGLDSIFQAPRNLITGDVNGVGSDVDDACIVLTDSIICSQKSELKMQEDNVSTDVKLVLDSSEVEVITLKPDLNSAQVRSEAVEVGSTDIKLTTKALSSVDHNMVDNPEVFTDGDADNNSNCVDASDFGVEHGLVQANDHNLQAVLEFETQGGHSCGEELEGKPNVERCVLHENESTANRFVHNKKSELQGGHDTIQQVSELALDVSPKACVDALHCGSAVLDLRSDQSILESAELKSKCRVKSLKTDIPHLSRGSVEETEETSCILKSNLTSALTLEETNGVVGVKNQILDAIHAGRYIGRESCLQRCNSSILVSAGSKVALGSHERICSRPSAGSTVDMYKPPTSNVKLFGQILSKPTQQNAGSNVHPGEGTSSLHNHVGRLHNVEQSSNLAVDMHLTPSKNNCNLFGGSENCPPRDFGVWDRSKMHNGFSSFANSAIVLAKYQTSFTNCAPSVKVEHHSPSHGVGKSGECSLNGVSVFPSRGGSPRNGVSDFDICRNREAAINYRYEATATARQFIFRGAKKKQI